MTMAIRYPDVRAGEWATDQISIDTKSGVIITIRKTAGDVLVTADADGEHILEVPSLQHGQLRLQAAIRPVGSL